MLESRCDDRAYPLGIVCRLLALQSGAARGHAPYSLREANLTVQKLAGRYSGFCGRLLLGFQHDLCQDILAVG